MKKEVNVQAVEKMVEKAELILRALKLPYAIMMPDGAKRGDLTVKEEKRRSRAKGLPRENIMPFYENLVNKDFPVGDILTVSVPEQLDVERFRGPLSSYCGKLWGKGSHMTSIDRIKRTVDILRLK